MKLLIITEANGSQRQDVFFTGCDYKGKQASFIPGFSSTRFAEAAEYAIPAIYKFHFDRSLLKKVETINGQDNNPLIRNLKPGAIGYDDDYEVIINVSVQTQLVVGLELLEYTKSILDDDISSDAIRTANYFVDLVLKNPKLFEIAEYENEFLAIIEPESEESEENEEINRLISQTKIAPKVAAKIIGLLRANGKLQNFDASLVLDAFRNPTKYGYYG